MPKRKQNRNQLIQKRKQEQEAKDQEFAREREITKNRKILGAIFKEELETKNRERKLELAKRKEREAILPSFEIKRHDDFADPRIIAAIPSAWKRIVDSPELTDDKLEDLQRARKLGFFRSKNGPFQWGLWFGSFLHSELAKNFEPATLRRVDLAVTPYDDSWRVQLDVQSLEPIRGFVACSPKRPRILLPEGEFVVAYNLKDDDHFIRRFEERTVIDPNGYEEKGQIFCNLYNRKYFELIKLPDNQYAARLWDWCNPPLRIGSLWKELLGNKVQLTTTIAGTQFFDGKEGRGHYLVGYCPIDVGKLASGYAILNTLLLPGMDNTPEAQILTRGLNTRELLAFQQRAQQQTMRNLNLGEDFSTIRLYHQHVPQVCLLSQRVFN